MSTLRQHRHRGSNKSNDGLQSSRKKLQRGVHTSTKQLEADIRTFIERHNENPKPYRWTKSADDILASVKRLCQTAERTLRGEL
jgi:hypothetical protein